MVAMSSLRLTTILVFKAFCVMHLAAKSQTPCKKGKNKYNTIVLKYDIKCFGKCINIYRIDGIQTLALILFLCDSSFEHTH